MSQKFCGDVAVLAAAGLLPHPQAGDDLRRGHVGLQPGQRVHPVRQRVEHLRVVEPLRGGQVPLPAGDRVQVGQRLGQAAVLVCSTSCICAYGSRPVRQSTQSPSLIATSRARSIAGQLVLVDQPGQVLVDHVIRRPDGLARLQPGRRRPRGTPTGSRDGSRPGGRGPAGRRAGRPGSARGPGRSSLPVFAYVSASADIRCPVVCPRTSDAGRSQPPQRLGRRGQAVVEPERAQHPVQVQEQQVRGVPGLVVPERASQQFHVGQRQRGGPARRAVRRVAARDRGGAGQLRASGSRGAARPGHVDQGLLGGQSAGPEQDQCLPPAHPIALLSASGLPGPSAFATSEILCPATAPPTILSSSVEARRVSVGRASSSYPLLPAGCPGTQEKHPRLGGVSIRSGCFHPLGLVSMIMGRNGQMLPKNDP